MSNDFLPGAAPDVLPGQSGGETPAWGSVPSPLALYPPLIAAFTNGVALMTLAAEEAGVTAYITLADSPPAGTASLLDLTGAVASFDLRSAASFVLVIRGNPGRIVGPTGPGFPANVAYDFSAADMAMLSPGLYRGAVLVLFPDGQRREFRGLTFQFQAEDSG